MSSKNLPKKKKAAAVAPAPLVATSVAASKASHSAMAKSSFSPQQDYKRFSRMTDSELKKVLQDRGLGSGRNKVEMLEKLGFPMSEWLKINVMKVVDLKKKLKAQNMPVTGNKGELLLRLGLPVGFVDPSDEELLRKLKENLASAQPVNNKKQAPAAAKRSKSKNAAKNQKKEEQLDPEDDSDDESNCSCFCCSEPDLGVFLPPGDRFVGYGGPPRIMLRRAPANDEDDSEEMMLIFPGMDYRPRQECSLM